MSSWFSYQSGGGGGGGSSGGGRWSPWGRAPPPTTPAVQPSDYQYLGPDDIVDPPASWDGFRHRGSHGAMRTHDEEDDGPDIISIKHKNSHYTLRFPAYSISEGRLRVSDVRRQAAEKLGVRESRRVKLIYKGNTLRDDAAAAGEEGLKQNSEITCVVTSGNEDLSSSDDDSASEYNISKVRSKDDQRSRDHSSQRTSRRSKGKRTGQNRSPPVVSPPDESGNDYFPSTSKNSTSTLDPRPTETPLGTSPKPSPSVFDPGLPSAKKQPLALKQLADLELKFRSELAPPCEKLLSDPPSDPKKRDFEVLKMNEVIERDVLLKVDEIDAEGRDDIRQKRKAFAKEVQAMLHRLDAAKKKWAAEK